MTRAPGQKYEYSTAAMALLGQAIALKNGTNYESLVVDRICRPLMMSNTRITLTPEMKTRFATGHNYFGYPVSASYWGAWAPGAALRSTANDLLRYVSANLGLTESVLTPLMKKTQIARFYAGMDTDTFLDTHIGLAWMLTRDLQGTKIVEHGGLTDGYISFICFDPMRRRGVVILANSQDFEVGAIGTLLLESEWRSGQRPTQGKASGDIDDSYVGKYQQTGVADPSSWPIIGIRRSGNQLFIQATRPKSTPSDVLLPPVSVELLPETENRFFERLSGMPITFLRGDQGEVAGLSVKCRNKVVAYHKTSVEPPKVSAPPKPRVAIKLGTKLLDAVVGHYEFAPNAVWPHAGAKLIIWREGDQLVSQEWGEDVLQGAVNVYPESETNFFIKLNGAQLTFIKDDKGEISTVRLHFAGGVDSEGKRISELIK